MDGPQGRHVRERREKVETNQSSTRDDNPNNTVEFYCGAGGYEENRRKERTHGEPAKSRRAMRDVGRLAFRLGLASGNGLCAVGYSQLLQARDAHRCEGVGTLSAVELRYEQVPGYAVPPLSEWEPPHERVFELLGFQPHPAPALSKPPEHAGSAPKTPT